MPIELTPKQRAYLRSRANRLKATVWVGKQGVVEQVIQAVDAALTSDELIKVKVLESAPEDRRDAATVLASATDSVVVQVLGRTMTLYRPRRDEPKIKLPEKAS